MTSSRENCASSRGRSSASVQKRKRSSISSCGSENGGSPCAGASLATHAGSWPPRSDSMMPSRKKTKPWPPASTTWLRASTSSWRGVAGERLAGGHEAAAHHLGQVLLVVAGTAAQLVRPGAEHGEDRALARLLQGRVRRLRARLRRVGELRPVDAAQALHGAGEPVQELGEDRAGVAAGAVEGAVGGDAGGGAHAVGSVAPEPGRRRLERRRQVGARVGVAHREDVDAVQGLLLAHDGERAGAHDARERRFRSSFVESVGRVGHLRSMLPVSQPEGRSRPRAEARRSA